MTDTSQEVNNASAKWPPKLAVCVGIVVLQDKREFIAEMQDEARWDALFKKTQKQLVAAARRAREEIAAGQAKPMDYDQCRWHP